MAGIRGFFKKMFRRKSEFNLFNPPGEVKDGNLGAVVASANEGEHDGLNLTGASLSARGIAKLSEMKALRALILKDAKIDDAALEPLKTRVELKKLDVSGTSINGSCFVKIGSLPELEQLDVSQTNFVDVAILALRKYPALSTLDLSGTRITDQGVPHITQLKALKELRLMDIQLDSAHLATFGDKPDIKIEWDL